MKITYTKLPGEFWNSPVRVRDRIGRITTFGDNFAYAAFEDGLSRAHQNGVTVTLIDTDGTVLVGTVEQLDNTTKQEA